MLPAIYGAIKIVTTLISGLQYLLIAFQKRASEIENARIEKARTDGNIAKTDEERIKAAREAQEANRHL